jgi:hypothetical protein
MNYFIGSNDDHLTIVAQRAPVSECVVRQLAEIVKLALMLIRDLENLLLEELPSRQPGSTHPSAIAHRVTKPGCAPPCEPESATASRTRFSSDSKVFGDGNFECVMLRWHVHDFAASIVHIAELERHQHAAKVETACMPVP